MNQAFVDVVSQFSRTLHSIDVALISHCDASERQILVSGRVTLSSGQVSDGLEIDWQAGRWFATRRRLPMEGLDALLASLRDGKFEENLMPGGMEVFLDADSSDPLKINEIFKADETAVAAGFEPNSLPTWRVRAANPMQIDNDELRFLTKSLAAHHQFHDLEDLCEKLVLRDTAQALGQTRLLQVELQLPFAVAKSVVKDKDFEFKLIVAAEVEASDLRLKVKTDTREQDVLSPASTEANGTVRLVGFKWKTANSSQTVNYKLIFDNEVIIDSSASSFSSLSSDNGIFGDASYDADLDTVGEASSEGETAAGSGVILDAKLDGGAYADIWTATDRFGRPVVVKFVRPSMAAESDAMAHAVALARATHPNVVTLYAVERIHNPDRGLLEDGIVMEFLEGLTLKKRLNKVFSVDEASAYTMQLLDGIEHIHKSGLAHGDLHVSNIMITTFGLKIIDILYRDTLDIIGTTSRENRLSRDLRDATDHIRCILEKSDFPPTCCMTFMATLGTSVGSVEQIRQALSSTLDEVEGVEEKGSELAGPSIVETVNDMIDIQSGDEVGSTSHVVSTPVSPVVWKTPNRAYSFLKFSPTPPLPSMTQRRVLDILRSNKTRVPYIGHQSSFTYSYSKFGGTQFAVCKDSSGECFTEEVSILQTNGQLLLLDGGFLAGTDGQICWDARDLEKRFRHWIAKSLEFYSLCFNSPRLCVVAGLVGIEKTTLVLPNQWSRKVSHPAYVNEVGYQWGLDEYRSCEEELRAFFGLVWEHYGAKRPEEQ